MSPDSVLLAESRDASIVDLVRAGDAETFRRLTESFSRELQVHCYRMVGSVHDAEDLVQETFARAWRRRASFEGRASVRAWLYKIATNACLDALARRPRRVLPDARGPAAGPDELPGMPIVEPIWLEPYPDALLDGIDDKAADPEGEYVAREDVTLAFLAAIQYLPPRQRATLILRDVLDWSAVEVADLLESSVASINSALQRARTTLRYHFPAGSEGIRLRPVEGERERSLLHRFLQAWEDADVGALVALLKEDAALVMPPTPTWYRGWAAVGQFISTVGFPKRPRFFPTRANRQPAFAVYEWEPQFRGYRALAIMVLTVEDGLVAQMTAFADPSLFSIFGFPEELLP